MNSPVFHKEGNKYIIDVEYWYFSSRYNTHVVLPKGYKSDGASGPAEDIVSTGWWVHDKLYEDKKWADGTKCSPWQSSMVLSDILHAEGRWFRAFTWFWATLGYESFSRKKK